MIHGAAYWEEMRPWLETGQGREERAVPVPAAARAPRRRVHVALSLLTASVVSVVFGAILMNYMAYYVSQVVRLTSSHPLLAALLGWHPWSVVRIVSFVTLESCSRSPFSRGSRAHPGGRRRADRWPWRFAAF